MKYCLITGGIISGLGKGMTASSIGLLLSGCGWRCTAIKMDPHINIDQGTFSQFSEDGEVFVLDDGAEVDLDLGNYERKLNVDLLWDNYLTTGKIYQSVIEKERRGEFLGKTVQVVPHITDAIQTWIQEVAAKPVDALRESADICVIELAGTVGDIESMAMVEALRQLAYRVGSDNFCHVHVSLVPVIGPVGEQKTKPMQHGVKELRSLGLAPDVLVCRCDAPIPDATREKLALFCQVPGDHIISLTLKASTYDDYKVPLLLDKQRVGQLIAEKLHMYLPNGMPRLHHWVALNKAIDESVTEVAIGIVAARPKEMLFEDTYLSVVKALQHASIYVKRRLVLVWISSIDLEGPDGQARDVALSDLHKVQGLVLPSCSESHGHGFDGSLFALTFAREKKIPMLSIGSGMHLMVTEIARNILKWADAEPCVDDMPTSAHATTVPLEAHHATTKPFNHDVQQMPMCRGSQRVVLSSSTCLSAQLYQSATVYERHRHQTRVNTAILGELMSAGLHAVGSDDNGQHVKVVELDQNEHPFFVGTQFHPEFSSRPLLPAPLFIGLVLVASKQDIRTHVQHIRLPPSRMSRQHSSPLM